MTYSVINHALLAGEGVAPTDITAEYNGLGDCWDGGALHNAGGMWGWGGAESSVELSPCLWGTLCIGVSSYTSG